MCKVCSTNFQIELRAFNRSKKRGYEGFYCSRECQVVGQTKYPRVPCLQCTKEFQVTNGRKKFCSQSCSCTYHNTHKTTGTRISKLELWLQKKLTEQYDFEIKFNTKSEINSELDIYIPSLKLAFELNGIFHYEPIFGKERLGKIQNNDNRKFQACIENNIELCIIDTSKQKYFKESTCAPFLEIIKKIIDKKISFKQDTPREGTS